MTSVSTTAYDPSNVFARMLRGEIPNDTLYEDEQVLAFRDINPQAKVHILVIPKGAYQDIHDFGARASETEIVAFYRAVSKIVEQEGLTAQGFRAIANSGRDAHQEVPHFHLHLLAGEALGPLRARS